MSKEQDFSDPLSFDNISNVEEWIRPRDLYVDDECGNSDWMALDPSSVNTMLLRPLNDEAEDLGEGKLQHVLKWIWKQPGRKCH